MASAKQYVFSARTTEEGLKALGGVKARLNIGWDGLVIDAISAHYQLDRAMMTLPKKTEPAKAESTQPAGQTSEERPTEPMEEKPPEEKLARKRGKKNNK